MPSTLPSTTSLAAAALLPLLLPAEALNNGVGQTPIMGWTSWITTGQGDLWQGSPFNVSARALKETGDYLVSTGLRDAGYDYVLLDDGWPACSEWRRGIAEASSCLNPSPRLDGGNVLVDKLKFPESAPGANDGIKVVADYLHAKGLKMGIYTAPHGRTCGGYWGMLGHEATDAQMFADWGIDLVKLDMGCRDDASIHDGTVLGSLERVRDGLNKTGRPMVFYVDAGNPTSGPKVVNPHHRGMANTLFTRTHVANQLSEAAWSWGPSTAHMWKIWFDRQDTWESLMSNVEIQISSGIPWFQGRGAIVNTDMLTVGRGGFAGGTPGMTQGQYRVEVFLYAMLSAPMVLSFDLSTLNSPKQALAKQLITNKEIIAIDQDPDVVMASRVYTDGRNPWGTDLWIKPLADGNWAVALINKDTVAHNMVVKLSGDDRGDFFSGPAGSTAAVRDLHAAKDLGNHTGIFNVSVPPMDGRMFKFSF